MTDRVPRISKKGRPRKTHGHSMDEHGRKRSSPTYNSWNKMRDRCLNPNSDAYHNYGGRGITVCDRWLGREGFATFLADMGERPDGLTLDRIDNERNYEPDNCRWATWDEQAHKRRRSGRFPKS